MSDICALVAELVAIMSRGRVPTIPWVGYATTRIRNPPAPHVSINVVLEPSPAVPLRVGDEAYELREGHLHVYNVHFGNRSESRDAPGRCACCFFDISPYPELGYLARAPFLRRGVVRNTEAVVAAVENLRTRSAPPGAPEPNYLAGAPAFDAERAHERGAGYLCRVQGAALELLGAVLDGARAPGTGEAGRLPAPVRKAIQYIGLHFGDPDLTLSRIAEAAYLSDDHFGRVFREAVGKSPFRYLLDLRIEQARMLLENTDHRVHEIAREVGFRDPFHFSRAFRRQTGLSPRNWRTREEHGDT